VRRTAHGDSGRYCACGRIGKGVRGLDKKNPIVRLELAEGIALSLTFKIGGELLRSVIVRDWNEILILGAIVALRGLLTFLIRWDIRSEKRSLREIDEKKKLKAS
jgi:Predicted membrane protein